MQRLMLANWEIQYDRAATAAVYERLAQLDAPVCDCDLCQNWRATRRDILPMEFQRLLSKLGIPIDGEIEICHYGRLESGLHLYGPWYHFVGRVVVGELESAPSIEHENFRYYFHSHPALLHKAFEGHAVVQLEVESEVPWLSDIPEAK